MYKLSYNKGLRLILLKDSVTVYDTIVYKYKLLNNRQMKILDAFLKNCSCKNVSVLPEWKIFDRVLQQLSTLNLDFNGQS